MKSISQKLQDDIRAIMEANIKHPNQQALNVHEPEKDEITAHDFKKLRAMKKKPNGKVHDCATHVEHTELGKGVTISEQHAEPDENGDIEWYAVQFDSGVYKVYTEDMDIIVSEAHHHGSMMKKEDTDGQIQELAGKAAQQAAIAISLIKAGKKDGKMPKPMKEDPDWVIIEQDEDNTTAKVAGHKVTLHRSLSEPGTSDTYTLHHPSGDKKVKINFKKHGDGDEVHGDKVNQAFGLDSKHKLGHKIAGSMNGMGGVSKFNEDVDQVEEEEKKKVVSPFDYKNYKSQIPTKPGETAGFDSKKISTGTVYSRKPVKEESHQSKTTMKHIPNASPALKKAAKDIKPGIAGIGDRFKMLDAGGVKREEVEIDEAYQTAKSEFVARQGRLTAAAAETEKDPARLKRMSNIPGYSAAMDLAKKTTQGAKHTKEATEYTFADYLEAARAQYVDEDAVLVANEAFKNQDITLFADQSQSPEA